MLTAEGKSWLALRMNQCVWHVWLMCESIFDAQTYIWNSDRCTLPWRQRQNSWTRVDRGRVTCLVLKNVLLIIKAETRPRLLYRILYKRYAFSYPWITNEQFNVCNKTILFLQFNNYSVDTLCPFLQTNRPVVLLNHQNPINTNKKKL